MINAWFHHSDCCMYPLTTADNKQWGVTNHPEQDDNINTITGSLGGFPKFLETIQVYHFLRLHTALICLHIHCT